MTLLGLALLSLLVVPVVSALRLGSTSSRDWDVMSEWQRRRLLEERHRDNPGLRR